MELNHRREALQACALPLSYSPISMVSRAKLTLNQLVYYHIILL